MAIKGNVGTGVIALLTTDTIVRQQQSGIDRYHVTSVSVFNDTLNSIAVDFYISPNLTSASGSKVASEIIGADDEIDINAIIGQGYANLNIIAVAAAVGMNVSMTTTEYTAGD